MQKRVHGPMVSTLVPVHTPHDKLRYAVEMLFANLCPEAGGTKGLRYARTARKLLLHSTDEKLLKSKPASNCGAGAMTVWIHHHDESGAVLRNCWKAEPGSFRVARIGRARSSERRSFHSQGFPAFRPGQASRPGRAQLACCFVLHPIIKFPKRARLRKQKVGGWRDSNPHLRVSKRVRLPRTSTNVQPVRLTRYRGAVWRVYPVRLPGSREELDS